jgi:hypothetical protein
METFSVKHPCKRVLQFYETGNWGVRFSIIGFGVFKYLVIIGYTFLIIYIF